MKGSQAPQSYFQIRSHSDETQFHLIFRWNPWILQSLILLNPVEHINSWSNILWAHFMAHLVLSHQCLIWDQFNSNSIWCWMLVITWTLHLIPTHLITIPSLFLAGVIFILSGFVYKLFGVAHFNQYFSNDNTQISLINDRFSILNEIEEVAQWL